MRSWGSGGFHAARLELRELLGLQELRQTGPDDAPRCSLAGMVVLAVVVALGLVASDLVELARRAPLARIARSTPSRRL